MDNKDIKIQLLLNILSEVTVRFDELFEVKKRLLEETNYKATHDILTGLFNREAFESKVKSSIKKSSKPLCIAFVDLDNFKFVNDTFGHAKGDEILVKTSQIMKENLKGHDIIGRIGGDEFVVALFDCDKECAKHLLNMIESAVINEFKRYEVSASIGAVFYPEDGTTYEELLKKADEKMYQVKESGKGRVEV